MKLKECGYCSHFDELNRCCWVIAPDGISRNVSESDECHLGFIDKDFEDQVAPNFEFDENDFNETCNGAGDHPNCVKCPRSMDGLGCAPDEEEQSILASKED